MRVDVSGAGWCLCSGGEGCESGRLVNNWGNFWCLLVEFAFLLYCGAAMDIFLLSLMMLSLCPWVFLLPDFLDCDIRCNKS